MNITKHLYLYIFLLCAISFGIYLFNASLMGADTWFYANQVCHKQSIDFRHPLFSAVLFLLPCNFIAIKLYLFALFVASLFTMSKIGELYSKEYGAFLGLITGFLTLVILEFQVFENDSLGYLLFFISLYYAVKYSRTNKEYKSLKDATLSIGFVIFASFAWKGVIYWLIPLVLFNPFTLIVAIPAIILNWGDFLWFLSGNTLIAEQTPFLAFIYYGIALFFLYGIIKTPKKEAFAFILMCIPGIFVQKLFILAIPFISIIALHAIMSLKKHQDTVINMILMFSFLMAIYWGIHSFNEFPTVNDIELVKYTKALTNSTQNAFGVGYILEFYGITPSSKGVTNGNIDYNCSGYVVEHPQLTKCDCNLIKISDNLVLKACDN